MQRHVIPGRIFVQLQQGFDALFVPLNRPCQMLRLLLRWWWLLLMLLNVIGRAGLHRFYKHEIQAQVVLRRGLSISMRSRHKWSSAADDSVVWVMVEVVLALLFCSSTVCARANPAFAAHRSSHPRLSGTLPEIPPSVSLSITKYREASCGQIMAASSSAVVGSLL